MTKLIYGIIIHGDIEMYKSIKAIAEKESDIIVRGKMYTGHPIVKIIVGSIAHTFEELTPIDHKHLNEKKHNTMLAYQAFEPKLPSLEMGVFTYPGFLTIEEE